MKKGECRFKFVGVFKLVFKAFLFSLSTSFRGWLVRAFDGRSDEPAPLQCAHAKGGKSRRKYRFRN